MTRLTGTDVETLTRELASFDEDLREVTGLDLRELALRTATDESTCIPLYGARMAAVPVSAGEGFIPGFAHCVVAILSHLGCEAWVTDLPDVRGIQEAVEAEADVVFLADDFRFVAVNLAEKRCIDDDPATADGYVTALEAAAGGLVGKNVLLLGLGPVGRAAARRLIGRGAAVHAVEIDEDRLAATLEAGLAVKPVTLIDGLAACDLIFDATPAADIVDVAAVGPGTIAAVPGMPSAFTSEAQLTLGLRHIHEPLAIGVAVMAARAML